MNDSQTSSNSSREVPAEIDAVLIAETDCAESPVRAEKFLISVSATAKLLVIAKRVPLTATAELAIVAMAAASQAGAASPAIDPPTLLNEPVADFSILPVSRKAPFKQKIYS